MPSLDTLPAEVIGIILSKATTSTVSSVSKTCKKLRSDALPELYRNVKIPWAGDFTAMAFLLLRTMLEQSAYRGMIHHLEFWRPADDWYTKDVSYCSRNYGEYSADRGNPTEVLFLPWLLGAKVDEDEEGGLTEQSVRDLVKSRLYHGDFVPPTIIRLCTELRSLAINAELFNNADEEVNWLEDIITDSILPRWRDTQLPLPRLNKLATLGVQHDRDPSSIPGEEYTYFWDDAVSDMSDTMANALYLPSLTDLRMARVKHVGDWTNGFHTWLLPRNWALPTKLPNPVNLKTLRLQYSDVQPAQIDVLLRHTPQLEVFSYDFNFDFSDEGTHSPLHDIQEASRHVQDTLRHLVLNIRGVFDAGLVGRLGSLKHLHKLEVLLISLPMIYDADQARLPPLAEVLPANLGALGLSDCIMGTERKPFDRWTRKRVLQHVRKYWQGRSPKLEWIRVDISDLGILRTWVDGREIRGDRKEGRDNLFELMSQDHWEASLIRTTTLFHMDI